MRFKFLSIIFITLCCLAPQLEAKFYINTLSVGLISSGESGYFFEAERYAWNNSSLQIQVQSNKLHSKATNEINMGYRYFPNSTRTGSFYGVGVKSFLLKDDWSKIGYFFEFGAKFPVRKGYTILVFTQLDRLEFDKVQNYRPSLGLGVQKAL